MNDAQANRSPAVVFDSQHAKESDDGGFLLKKLLSTRTLLLSGAINERVASRFINQLLVLEADDGDKPITVLLNSPGGSVSDGLAIYDAMRFVTPPLRIVCVGLAASIATVILLGADKKDRLALPNTRLLIHQPLIPMEVFGPASDLEITAREILKTRDQINRMLAEETGQPLERVERDTQRDYWLSAEEAVEYGLLSRIVRTRSEL